MSHTSLITGTQITKMDEKSKVIETCLKPLLLEKASVGQRSLMMTINTDPFDDFGPSISQRP